MKNEVRTTTTLTPQILESLVLKGDLGGLNPQQKVEYYNYRCQQVGLDPSAKPFDIMNFQGKQVLYANKSCADQLMAIHGLSVQVIGRDKFDDVYVTHVRVTGKDGRYTENMGAISIANLKGTALEIALLKGTTKGSRRAVLTHCGLGELDETEEETLREYRPEPIVVRPGDAEPTTACFEIDPEWTEEERETAKMALMDSGEAMCAGGWQIDDPKIQATLKKYRNEIGDPSIRLSNWLNRLALATDRAVKAAPKPLTDTSGDHSALQKQPISVESSATSDEPTTGIESLNDKALNELVCANWLLLTNKWNQSTADGRQLAERHRNNRTNKRIELWAPGLTQGTREWLLAVADGQTNELNGATNAD